MQLVHDGKINLDFCTLFFCFFSQKCFLITFYFCLLVKNLPLTALLPILILLEFFWYFFYTPKTSLTKPLGKWALPNDYLFEELNLLDNINQMFLWQKVQIYSQR